MAARTISSGYGSPTPQAWLRSSRRRSSLASSGLQARLPAEQPQLDDPGGVEAVDAQDRPRSRDGGAGRHQADELRPGDLRAAGLGLGDDALDDLVERRGFVVLDVHAHLDDSRARQIEPERPHARVAAVALAHARRDLAGDV